MTTDNHILLSNIRKLCIVDYRIPVNADKAEIAEVVRDIHMDDTTIIYDPSLEDAAFTSVPLSINYHPLSGNIESISTSFDYYKTSVDIRIVWVRDRTQGRRSTEMILHPDMWQHHRPEHPPTPFGELPGDKIIEDTLDAVDDIINCYSAFDELLREYRLK